MSDLIQALKTNKLAFCYMPKELQDKAVEIGPDEFQKPDTTRGQGIVMISTVKTFRADIAVTLRPDYAEKPSVVEMAVFPGSGGLRYRAISKEPFIDTAVSDPDFIGFKFDDSKIAYPDPRRYRDKNGQYYSFWRPGYEVLTPTAVLFQGDTK